MRVTTLLVLSGLIAFSARGRAQVPTGERKAFRYGDWARGGALIRDYANRWVEVVGTEERYLFEEIGRSNGMIELIDRPRDVGLKVHADRGWPAPLKLVQPKWETPVRFAHGRIREKAMDRRRDSPLRREAERDLTKGLTVSDICHKHGISQSTYYRKR